MDAATAAVDAAVAATSVAAAAMEAATDATVMAIDSAGAMTEVDVDVSRGGGGSGGMLRGPETPPPAPSVESAAPEARHTLGLVGAGGRPGPGSGDEDISEEEAGGVGIGGAAAINIGLSPAAAMAPGSPPLAPSRPLHTVAAGRPHVSPADIPEHARTYGRIGAGGEPGHGRRAAGGGSGGGGAGGGDVSSSSDVEGEAEAPVAVAGETGSEGRTGSGVPGAFGAVKSLIEEAAAGGVAVGGGGKVEQQAGGVRAAGEVAESPAGPALVEP